MGLKILDRKYKIFAIFFAAIFINISCFGNNRNNILADERNKAAWYFMPDSGAVGKLDLPDKKKQPYFKLTWNVVNGGNWVGAQNNQPDIPPATEGLTCNIKCPGTATAWIYLTDATGQLLKFRMSRPIYKLNESNWYSITLSFTAIADSFSNGAANGKINGVIKSLAVVAEPRMDPWYPGLRWFPQPKGEMLFDGVRWVSNFTEHLSLLKNKRNAKEASVLWGLTGICANSGSNEITKLTLIDQLGYRVIRKDLRWNQVEKVKGIYNFSKYDLLANTYLKHGLKMLFILDYGNKLYMPDGLSPVTDSAISAFARYCITAVKHFRNKNIEFEIWNEPNLARFWKPASNAAQFAHLLSASVDSIRKVYKSVKLISGGTAGIDWRFIDSLNKMNSLIKLDGIGIHPYRTGSPETIAEDLACLHSVLKKNNIHSPLIYSTESGGYSSAYGNGFIPGNRHLQAVNDLRSQLTGWMAGFSCVIKYELLDGGRDSLNHERNYGILDYQLHPKPSFVALKMLFEFTKNRVWMGNISCKNSSAYAMQFNGKKDVLMILWTSMGKLDIEMDTYKTKFMLPAKPLTVKDIMGMDLPVIKDENGNWSVEAGGEVIYITLKK